MTKYKDIGRTEITIDKRAQFSSSQGQRGSSLVLRSVAGQKSGREGRDHWTKKCTRPFYGELKPTGLFGGRRCFEFISMLFIDISLVYDTIGKADTANWKNNQSYSRVKENEIARG